MGGGRDNQIGDATLNPEGRCISLPSMDHLFVTRCALANGDFCLGGCAIAKVRLLAMNRRQSLLTLCTFAGQLSGSGPLPSHCHRPRSPTDAAGPLQAYAYVTHLFSPAAPSILACRTHPLPLHAPSPAIRTLAHRTHPRRRMHPRPPQSHPPRPLFSPAARIRTHPRLPRPLFSPAARTPLTP